MALTLILRGHVYCVEIDAVDPAKRGRTIDKYAVMLQSLSVLHHKNRVSVVLSTSKTERKRDRWNVFVPAATCPFWQQDTLILCGDVWSLGVDQILKKEHGYCGELPDEVMHKVDVALALSLQLA
jgi:mRNA-degrading endonuclease toxin of MazEF toxin-antitoxin module